MMNINFSNLKNISKNKRHKLNSAARKILCVGTIGLLSLSSFNVLATDYARAEKELNIMSNIFQTALTEAKVKNRNRHFSHSGNKPEAIYLAKQGMVFSFNFGSSQFGSMGGWDGNWRAFGEDIGELVGSITAEIAQSFSEYDIPSPAAPPSPIDEEDWGTELERFEHYQEEMEILRDEQRSKRREVRELQRSIRDIERQARHEESDEKHLNQTKEKLKLKMKKLSEKMAKYEESRKLYKEKKIAKFKLSNQKKAGLITTILCDYGSTLRSLNNDEHITLIFKNYENHKDQLYVFSYKDVNACKNKDALLKKSIIYQM